MHGVDHGLLQRLGRCALARERVPERRRRTLQVDGLLPAGGAPLDMEFDGVPVLDRGDAEGELRQHVANRGAVHDSSFCWFARRTLIRADRRRVFTVPKGIPSSSEISRAVIPRKYVRRTRRRSASDSDAIARRAASRSSRRSSSTDWADSGTSSTSTSLGRVTPVSRRRRSIAWLWAMVISHVDRRPRWGSKRAAFRQAVTKTSWVSSSAASREPSKRRPIV